VIPTYVTAAVACDEAGWTELHARHRHRVYTICYRVLRNESDAADATQDVFVHLIPRLRSFRGDCAFSTWLHRVTVNVCLMRLRRSGERFHRSLAELDIATPAGKDEMSQLVQSAGERDSVLKMVAARSQLTSAMAKLPPGYRRVLILKDVLGYTHRDVAKILGKSPGLSKSQLQRAREKMRGMLRRDEFSKGRRG
jgi:RNA polymerase sigma-70 factor (ECF subfamily)